MNKKPQSVTDSDAAVSRVVEAAAVLPPHEGRIRKNMTMLAIVGFGLEVSNGWSGISGRSRVGE